MEEVCTSKTKKPESSFYLLLEGVKGSAREAGYEGWIPLNSCQFGTGVAISYPSRGERDRRVPEITTVSGDEHGAAYAGDIIVDETDEEAFYRRVREGVVEVSQPSLSEMTISKFTDASSPVLFHLATLRRPLRRAVIEHVFDRTTTRFTLSPVFISSFSAAADQMPEKDEDEDGEQHEDYGRESLSLNFHSVEMHVVDKVRRPLALPKTPAFGMYDPHQAEGAFPLPLELIVSVFLWLDQQSLSRAAQVSKRLAFAASDEQLKVFVAHSVAYDHTLLESHLDGQLVEPFWPPTSDDDSGNSGW